MEYDIFNSSLTLTFALFGCITLIYVSIVFLIAQIKSDNSVMDIFYGPAFAVASWGTLIITKNTEWYTLVALSLLTLWATRLSVRIARKNWGAEEDARYAKWRTEWSKRGTLYFILRSYIQINLLQGLVVVVVSTPLILLINGSLSLSNPVFLLGVAVFCIGLTLEAVADMQLDSFVKRKKAGTEPATLMRTGLFAYSRRPNYFGESLIWWGFAIMALTTQFGVIAFISPLVITYILTKVTGPMLETFFLERYPEEYRDYMNTTNYFIPWFPKTTIK